MDFLKSLAIATSGLRAEAGRMRVISENLANANSTAKVPGGDPYRRRIPTFQTEFDRALEARVVAVGPVRTDPSEFDVKYQPGHPAADAKGFVKYPNVNELVESQDMREAMRSYEANINIIGATRRMIQRTIDILRG
jgi:flagellar basal-body rod protein FlgC